MRNFRKLIVLIVAAILFVVAVPNIFLIILFAWNDFQFRTTKPDGHAILASVFPDTLTQRDYLHLNAERVKFIRDDTNWGSGRVQEGGACAIVDIADIEQLDELNKEISSKFALLDFNTPGSISRGQTSKTPSSAVCNFLPKSGWSINDYQILVSSSNCTENCDDAGEFQEYSAFYNPKLKQILIEWLDYDGDHANSFP